jgi:hypothetical protein
MSAVTVASTTPTVEADAMPHPPPTRDADAGSEANEATAATAAIPITSATAVTHRLEVGSPRNTHRFSTLDTRSALDGHEHSHMRRAR